MARAAARPDPAQLPLFGPDELPPRARIADRLRALLAPADPAEPDAASGSPGSPWPDSFFDTGPAPLD